MSTNENNTTTAVRSSAFNYASNLGNSNRICKRFESCFIGGISFEDAINKWSNVAGKLMFLSQDIGLNRQNMTRSQIVMAYNKQNNAWRGIVMYLQMNPERAYNIINSFSIEGMTCADARTALIAKFAQSNERNS